MAKDNKFVTHLTPREEDFSQWYTDVILKSEMVDYAPVRGCMAIRPYGYRIWEIMQKELDTRLKETGHENVMMPTLIPESLLLKEAEHVEGFAPEVAWVTHGGTEALTERFAIRPTSETLFCAMYSKWVQSWRDLPKLYNQWCSVMRWEKTTRPFLRTSEFLWQEGHTIHSTIEEAEEETLRILEMYREFCETVLALPLFLGRKTESEKFAGARATYTIEAMMQDGKALQSGTTHFFGDNFAKVFDVQFLDKDGTRKYVQETSWGVSSRLIGAIVMTHGDERGLILPPRVAPIQAVILPIAAHKGGVLEKARDLEKRLNASGIRVYLDDRETQSAGWKFNEWELKGVPLRVEMGPRDIENGQVMICRRDTFEKTTVPIDGVEKAVMNMLDEIHGVLLARATAFKEAKTKDVFTLDQLREQVQTGYARAMWCGEEESEAFVKAEMSATIRALPFDQTPIGDTCVVTGKPAKYVVYFAKAY